MPDKQLSRRQNALILAVREAAKLLKHQNGNGKKRVPFSVCCELSRRIVSQRAKPPSVLKAIEDFDDSLLCGDFDSNCCWSNRAPDQSEVNMATPGATTLTITQLAEIIKRY